MRIIDKQTALATNCQLNKSVDAESYLLSVSQYKKTFNLSLLY